MLDQREEKGGELGWALLAQAIISLRSKMRFMGGGIRIGPSNMLLLMQLE